MKRLLLLLSFVFTTATLPPSVANAADYASANDPAVFLLKITQRLTGNGSWPTPEDYQKLADEETRLNCSEISCLDSYFRAYISEQMNSTAFLAEATLKTYEKFSFQTPAQLSFINAVGTNISPNAREMLLVDRVFTQDLSIDELFSSQIVWRFDDKDSAKNESYSFQIEGKPAHHPKPLTLTFATTTPAIEEDYTGHPNISGLFSTPTFLNRNWNTPINSARKRAGAFFRIMFCDSMFPALDRDGQAAREHAQAMGVSDSAGRVLSFEEIVRSRHANQKDCNRCHEILEPVTFMMRPLELGVAKFATSANMVLKDTFENKTIIPVKGFHDMVVKATQQPRYLDCQMSWLTNWIIGNDADIHPLRYEEMLKQFDQNGRKVKTTITDLLMSPEFRGESKQVYAEPVSLKKAKAVFSNCYECHHNFLQTHGDGLRIQLSKISGKLDLEHDGKSRIMPPSDHWWAPSDSEVQDVKNWILEGAPLVRGQAFLTPSQVQQILHNPRPGATP